MSVESPRVVVGGERGGKHSGWKEAYAFAGRSRKWVTILERHSMAALFGTGSRDERSNRLTRFRLDSENFANWVISSSTCRVSSCGCTDADQSRLLTLIRTTRVDTEKQGVF